MKIAYCTPSLYIPGGIERVLTVKANYLADVLGYDIYIILTDGKGNQPYYPLSPKIHIINLDINFEALWNKTFIKKGFIYLQKQRIYKKKLKNILFEIKPDITVSLLRREINFITSIQDGSAKIGELHVNKQNYRNFEKNNTNIIKNIFSYFWMRSLVRKLKQLNRFIVLSQEDKANWNELNNVSVIPNPLPSNSIKKSKNENKGVIAVGRYTYQKGFDLLLKAWSIVSRKHPDWKLSIFGSGNKDEYIQLAKSLHIEEYCHINPSVTDIYDKYCENSIFVLSSRFEGFGMVLIEAMNCGVPVISFACPCGPKDIIHPNEDGLLVENGNIEVLAEKICYLIEHPEERIRIGKNAITNAERYKIENIAKQWDELFQEIIKNRNK